MDLLPILASRIVPADGAMGTLLLGRGATWGECLEAWCITQPEAIRRVHDDYIAAGAAFIRTHTFGSNHHRLQGTAWAARVVELNTRAVAIAREAAEGAGAIVAGSLGPTGAGEAGVGWLAEQAAALVVAGVDALIFETFTDPRELLGALRLVNGDDDLSVIASVVCDRNGRVGGREIQSVWDEFREAGADVVGVNCAGTPAEVLRALGGVNLEKAAVFPSAGLPAPDGSYGFGAEQFAAEASLLVERGVRLIGGCCGTTPAYIAALTARLPLAA